MAEPKNSLKHRHSWIEVENWIIIDFNPITGSITEYEDYELSAESFLIELKTMHMLPSLRMPIPETSLKPSIENEEMPSDHGAVTENQASGKAGGSEFSGDEKAIHLPKHTPAHMRTERVRAEITRNLNASLEAEVEPTKSDGAGAETESTTPEREESDHPSDSPNDEGSGSPHTDPDFLASSSDGTDIEWILRGGMVGLKVSDSLLSVGSQTGESVRGDIHENNGEEVKKGIEEFDGLAERIENHAGEDDKLSAAEEVIDSKVKDKRMTWVTEELEDNIEKSIEDAARRRDLRNVGLAASATGVILAAIWMIERSAG
jgi:hypothetical protein